MEKFDIPEPKKIAPQLTMEQRRAMQPVDLLVQYVMPKLLDKVNYLEWAVKAEFHSVRETIAQMEPYLGKTGDLDRAIMGLKDRLTAIESRLADTSAVTDTVEKSKRNKQKKKPEEKASVIEPPDSMPPPVEIDVDVTEPVAVTDIAQYDPQTDRWVPKVIDGVEITASVIDMVAAGTSSYSIEVATFIYDLSESERKVLRALFPDEIMKESNG